MLLGRVGAIVGALVSLYGWTYWALMVFLSWNFISWLILVGGMALTFPSIMMATRSRRHALRRIKEFKSKDPAFSVKELKKTTSLRVSRRIKLAGWLLAIVMTATFPNVSIVPSQIYRRFNNWETVITPQDPLVLHVLPPLFSAEFVHIHILIVKG